MAGRGRRPGQSTTRQDIRSAALRLFAERGFQTTTMRAIAAAAGVNVALVHHYYGSKEQLFIAAMNLPLNPVDAMQALRDAGPSHELGERLVRFFVHTWRDPATGQPLRALLRSAAATDAGAATMRQFIDNVLLPRIAAIFEVPPLRVAGAFAQLIGYALAGEIVGVEPLTSATEDELTALLAPSVQRYLDPAI